MDQAFFDVLGVTMVFASFAIAFIAVLLWVLMAVKGRGKVRSGGAVLIGPFPIVFGTYKESVRLLLLLSIGLIVLLSMFSAFSYYAFK